MARKPPKPPRGDYEVGYGKPPQHSRFQPGQSGNPHGRAKGSVNLSTLVEKALGEKVAVREGGQVRRISKAAVIATQLVNKAAGADPRALKLLFDCERRRGDARPADSDRGREGPPPAKADPPSPPIDMEKMTTAELATLYEAALILEGKQERPPSPMPPGEPAEWLAVPEKSEEETS